MYPEILKDFKSLHINYEMLNHKKAIISPPPRIDYNWHRNATNWYKDFLAVPNGKNFEVRYKIQNMNCTKHNFK